MRDNTERDRGSIPEANPGLDDKRRVGSGGGE